MGYIFCILQKMLCGAMKNSRFLNVVPTINIIFWIWKKN